MDQYYGEGMSVCGILGHGIVRNKSPGRRSYCHLNGKLALTFRKNRRVKTFYLIKGRTAYVTNIKAVADSAKWSLDGAVWAVSLNNVLNIYEVKSAGINYTMKFKKRVNIVLF
jgi:protein MAK11